MMRKHLAMAAILLTLTSSAQFHVELGPSFQSPSGELEQQYELGVGFSIEPRVAVSDKFALGVYVGALAFAGGDLMSDTNEDIDAAGIVPVVGTATLRVLDAKVTPYLSGGLGYYRMESATIDDLGNIGPREKSGELGYMARGGLFLGRMNFGASYHRAGELSFLQLSLGVRIGPWW